jgi:RNA polymerase sigma-70 factor (ECF subfamily)
MPSQYVNYNDFVFDVEGCLSRVRSNDQHAAKELVDYLHSLVIKIVKSRKPWRMADEDLMQEIFMKMFTRLGQYKGDVPFRHWVSRIAVNTCIDNLKYNKRRPEYRMADMSEEEAEHVEGIIQNQVANANDSVASTELVNKLLAELDEEDEMVLRLLDIEQKTLKEIASITGWKVSKVKVRAFRARKKLHQMFKSLQQKENVGIRN